jgi:DNA-binding MarR family transcriptional regulator
MSNLSNHQFAALVALLEGPSEHKALAAKLGIKTHSLAPIMRALQDRGLIKPSGRLNRYTYTLTAAGRLQAEKSDGAA